MNEPNKGNRISLGKHFPFKLVWYISDTFFPSLPTPAYPPFKMFSFQVLLFICSYHLHDIETKPFIIF